MRYFLILGFYLFNFHLFSQSISKDVISSAGSTFQSQNNSLNFSVGETVVGSMTGEDYSIQLGNGYYPSLDLEALSVESYNIKINVFPNPSSAFIFISSPENTIYELTILNLNSKLIHKGEYRKDEPINIQNLTPGTYIVTILDNFNKKTNSYKIIKK